MRRAGLSRLGAKTGPCAVNNPSANRAVSARCCSVSAVAASRSIASRNALYHKLFGVVSIVRSASLSGSSAAIPSAHKPSG